LAARLGAEFSVDPQMSFEAITLTSRQTIVVREIPFKIELFHLSDDPYDQERFQRRRKIKLLDREVSLLTAEDVIITKLLWFKRGQRAKDGDDAQGVIAVQGARIDWPYVYSWCDRHGTRDALDELRRSLPDIGDT
jgi:hypothetical protein